MSAREELHAAILSTLTDRNVWEQRQIQLYDMRNKGLRRKFKPFPTASDLHWPLIDTNIEKVKPEFFQQIIGSDTVASFISKKTQDPAYATIAERWFDYEIKECSNFQDVALSWIDFGLLSGRSVLKVSWDADREQVRFEAIPTLYSIAPIYAKILDEMDWWVHVMPMSLDAYKRDGRYDTSKEVLDQIKGGDADESLQTTEDQNRKLREGITYSDTDNQVIVWEVYRRVTKDKVVILTYSPSAPNVDLRPQKLLPFEHKMLPAVDMAYEVTDGGWYSPRGIADQLAPFEVSLCNVWNHKHDAMAFFNRPLFKAEREIPNTGNLRLNPGGVLPYGLAPVPMQQSSVDFDEEMTLTRSIAEQRVANPDYGMGQVINTKNRRTATEINAVGAQSANSGTLRARCFRISLSKVYRMAYSILVQYKKKSLIYRFQGEVAQAPQEAIHDGYDMEPKGGLNETNRVMKMQAAQNRLQILSGSPYWNRAELEKDYVALDEPSLIRRSFQDPNQKQQSESADEMTIIPSLMLGLPVPPMPGQDYMTRIGVDMQFLQQALGSGVKLPPMASQAIVGRMDAMLTQLEQQNVNGARQLRKSVGDFLTHAGLMPGGAPGQPGGQGAPQGGPPAPPAATPSPPPDPLKPKDMAPAPPGPLVPPMPGTIKEVVEIPYKDAPEDIKRQMEIAAGWMPSQIPPPPPPGTPPPAPTTFHITPPAPVVPRKKRAIRIVRDDTGQPTGFEEQ